MMITNISNILLESGVIFSVLDHGLNKRKLNLAEKSSHYRIFNILSSLILLSRVSKTLKF